MTTPTPQPRREPRRVFCRRYGSCLDLAVRGEWPGFACGSCCAYQEEAPSDPDHWRDQGDRCRLLLAKIFGPRKQKRTVKSAPVDLEVMRAAREESRARFEAQFGQIPFDTKRWTL
jgi:hypothetical protein